MQAFKLTLRPNTAFGTPLVGDTLFGQICWGIVEQFGETVLSECLQGYTKNRPFLVVSDAFPAGYLPLPTLPSFYWASDSETDRKTLKKRQWLPLSALDTPRRSWQQAAKSSSDIAVELQKQGGPNRQKNQHIAASLQHHQSQPHNSLNRQTHTTGAGGQFAPYESEQIWYAQNSEWEIYLLLDTGRLKAEDLHTVIANIGLSGYGRDASAGLGKFSITDWAQTDLFAQQSHGASAWTLAPCCPQNQGFDPEHSYYQIHTRFGRHGNIQATAGRPFKKPVLMAQTGAVFGGVSAAQAFIGQGIGSISAGQPQAVHQGYAPVLRLDLAADTPS